jgi:hypothetical protein
VSGMDMEKVATGIIALLKGNDLFDPDRHVIVYQQGGDHPGDNGFVKCRQTGKLTDWYVEGYGSGDPEQRACIIKTFNREGWKL